MEGIELPAALALLLRLDLTGAHQWNCKRHLDVLMAGDLAADCRGPAGPDGEQDAQSSTTAAELLGMGIAPHHHRRAFGDGDAWLLARRLGPWNVSERI
jgi:hypothetical protein